MINFDQKRNVISAISMNKERDKCMVGGRYQLCIVKLEGMNMKEEPKINLLKNMRPRKSTLEQTALEIQWNQQDSNNIIFCCANSVICHYNVTKEKLQSYTIQHILIPTLFLSFLSSHRSTLHREGRAPLGDLQRLHDDQS